ncbi:MAG: signal peptidase I [Brevundimonas sp.]|nr:MAG: signal peptidase I [Brevundimonas sp.]
MSDENKPHDDHAHGHDDHAHGHDDHAPLAAHDDHGHEDHAPPAEAHGHDDHAAPAEAAHEAHAPVAAAHDEHGHDSHAAAAHDDHAAPAHDEHHAEPVVAHDDHGHAAGDHHAAPVEPAHDAHAEAVHNDHAAVEPHPGPVETVAAVAGAAAVTPAQPERRPVWSDAGDAPFEDVDTTPVYARGKKGKKSRSSGGGAASEGWEIIKTIVFALLIALVLRTVLFQPFTIPSASMEPNLYQGDYIVVSKWSYGYSKHSIPFSPPIFEGRILERTPTRGDIVVFKLPRDNKTDYIKRLIGMPGDRIQMINNVLHINGAPVRDVVVSNADVTNMYGMPIVQADETFPDGSRTFRIQDFGPGNDLDDTPVFEVPNGYYFMMGDNRDNSIDSRVDASQNGVGLVPAENLIGKAEIILFSWNEGASFYNPVSWFSKVRLSRWFKVLD